MPESLRYLPRLLPGPPTEEAGDTPALTPVPGQADQTLGGRRVFDLGRPEPEHIDAIYHHSNEVASTIKRIRQLVWRQRPVLEPAVGQRCRRCGAGIEDDADECPTCESDDLRPPDPEERERFETFIAQAGDADDTLWAVGEHATDDTNLHGTGYIVHRYQYLLDPDGRIAWSQLHQTRRGDPRLIEPVIGEDGNQGGQLWMCLACRDQDNYTPQDRPGTCPQCDNILYDVWWQEVGLGGAGHRFYASWEVPSFAWHYPDGSSPVTRVWDKAITLLWMDKVASRAFDPRYEKSPGKLLVTMGGSQASMEEWVEREEEKRAENPYRLAHLHIESRQDLSGDAQNLDSKVLNLSEEFIKGQSQELRAEFKENLRTEFGLNPLDMGDTTDAGGLNNESQQLRSTAQVIEDVHRSLEAWFDALADALNVQDWVLRFPRPLEEDESRDLETARQKLEVAGMAADRGLEVEWREGDITILDGTVSPPSQTADPAPDGGMDSTSVRSVEAAENPQHTGSYELPQQISTMLQQPSGEILAADELFERYADVDRETAAEIGDVIQEEMTDPEGWSVRDIRQNLTSVLAEAGIENPGGRAETIARTETASIVSEARKRRNEQLAASRPSDAEPRFRVVGADDHRTTKISHWIRDQVGEGVVHDDLVEVLDEAVERAKRGDFAEDGALSSVEGMPITLPDGFSRRGYTTHFNDRDRVERVIAT